MYLDEELLKRRDKRLKLASRRRAYEANDATKRKRATENAVWSWWKVPSCLNAKAVRLTRPSVRARRTPGRSALGNKRETKVAGTRVQRSGATAAQYAIHVVCSFSRI